MELYDYLDKMKDNINNELDKVRLLMYYEYKTNNVVIFTFNNILILLQNAGYANPNISRLKLNMQKERRYIINEKTKEIKFTPLEIQKLNKTFGNLFENFEYIESNSDLLDEAIFYGKRGYLDKLIKQANCTYKTNCYDACAVILRRIFEITLILSYQVNGIEQEIKNGEGTYMMLEKIVANAKSNTTLNLSRTKKEYDKIRDIGNFAAHKLEYNTFKSDIDNISILYRTALEELYYKAKIII